MITRLLVLLLFIGGISDLRGAPKSVEWLETIRDLGYLNETEGPVKVCFRLVNKGGKPVEISEVKTSCGCTEAEYTGGEILRGDTAAIIVTFDPYERPGRFDKGIYVYLKDRELPEILRIKGTVLVSCETLQLFYPFSAGQLHADRDTLDFGEMKKGVRKREFIDLYNSGREPIKIRIDADSEGLSWVMDPKTLEPGENGTLTLFLDSALIPWTGVRQMTLRVGGGDSAEIQILVKVLTTP